MSKKWSRVKWMRISQFYLLATLFSDEIKACEIRQGALSNCYFLSVIAALAEYPERIKELFLIRAINYDGVYAVKICKDGEWIEVVVDDFFPCDNIKGIPCFSTGALNSMWVSILEKCYAKAYGSYYKTENGSSEHTMRDFTGAPTVTYDNSNAELLSALREAYEKRWIITASAGDTEASKELLKEVGLIPMHSYSIVLVYTLQNDNESNFSYGLNSNLVNQDPNLRVLLKIRNPWGKNEWIGDWSDYSNLWRDDLKEKLNYSDKDGCFFMNLKDFKHYFSKIQICKKCDDYLYTSIKLKQKTNYYCLVKVSVTNQTHLFLSLIQPDKKNYHQTDHKYGISRFIISKINSFTGEIEYIIGKMGQEREIFEDKIFMPGEYLLFTEIDTVNEMVADIPYVVSAYSSEKVELSEIDIATYPKILEQIYVSCAKRQNEVIKFTNEGAPNCLKYTNTTPEGYAYIYFENNEEDATLIEDVKYTKFEGLKLMHPFSGTSYRVVVGPGETKIVLIKQIEINGYNLIYSYQ